MVRMRIMIEPMKRILAVCIAAPLLLSAINAQEAAKPPSPEVTRLEAKVAEIEAEKGMEDPALVQPLIDLGKTGPP
jgi:hypothetical protein